MKKLSIIFTIAAAIMLFVSCSKEKEQPTGPSSDISDVTNLAYTVVERAVTLTWQLPENENVLALQVVCQNDGTFRETDGPTTSYLIARAPVAETVTYLIRVITDKGISQGVSVSFYIEPESQPVPAMLLLAADPEALPDDDEVAAATWFKKNYVDKNNGAFISASDLRSLSVNDYSVVFILVDRVGQGAGWQNLPLEIVLEENRQGMLKYLAEGGNFFFAKMATQLVNAIGRIDEKYAPGIFGDGEGGVGDDTWCVNANIGIGTYDHRSHPIYQLMEASTTFYDFEVYPLLGPGGHREDHNTMWDCNAYGFPGDPNVIKNFEDATSSTVLGTWGHVSDYCCAGIVEFGPTSEYKGTIIANGLSAYEFHQNNQDNQYEANIYRLTENTINYLHKLHD